MDDVAPSTPRVRVKRLPERGRYDRGTIDRILDEDLNAIRIRREA